MTARKGLLTALKVLGVCFLFALCFVMGAALSGLDKIGQQVTPAQPAQQNFLGAFLTFSICAGVVLSYLILRSEWRGWPLVGAIWLGMYGISTVASQVESVFFLSDKLPHGMITALFLQGAITATLFAPLAVLILGRWRAPSPVPTTSSLKDISASSVAWRLAFIVVAFIFLYMFFGYYVAWRNPDLRQYYGGIDHPNFFASLSAAWVSNRAIYWLQIFRALLYTACLYPLIRMLRVARWETALAMALFLSAWTTVLLLPNPLMPPSVAHSHFWETLGFSLVFGALTGSLLWRSQIPTHSAGS